MKKPVTVTITGAAGQIGYALAFRVASGQLLGNDQPVNLHLLEITPTLPALQGVVMELNDCAFPLLNKVVATDDAKVAFKDSQVALLVGARPRGPGMERKDLLLANAQIFSAQGKAMNEVADRNIKVLVVGNPANTNAMIARANAMAPSWLTAPSSASRLPRIRPVGRGAPIGPVLAISTCSVGQPSIFARATQHWRASAMPCSPVAQLALRALTRTARTLPRLFCRCSRHRWTWAPTS